MRVEAEEKAEEERSRREEKEKTAEEEERLRAKAREKAEEECKENTAAEEKAEREDSESWAAAHRYYEAATLLDRSVYGHAYEQVCGHAPPLPRSIARSPMYIHTHARTCLYIFLCTRLYSSHMPMANVYAHGCIHDHIHACSHVYAHFSAHTYARVYARVHTHAHTHIHVYKHVHALAYNHPFSAAPQKCSAEMFPSRWPATFNKRRVRMMAERSILRMRRGL